MAVNITNINELISPSAGGPSTWSNMGATEQNDCHTFKLSGSSTCGDLTDTELFLEIEAFDVVNYQKTVKSFEIAPGKDIETYKAKDPRISFTLIGDESLHNLLQIIESHQTILFTNLIGEQEEEVHQMIIEPTDVDSLLSIKITLSFKDAETVSKICCGSYYENALFNECDGEGETGDPNNDPECEGYAVSIAFTEDPDTLTASTVGGDGVETFKWYKDGVFFGTGAAINPVLSGVYRVDAKKGNCTDSAEFTFSAGCEGFEVSIQSIVHDDGTVTYIALANLVSTYQWQEEIDSVWTDIEGETGISFTPAASGIFRVVATSGECEVQSDSVDYELPASCDGVFDITLTNEDGILTVTIIDYEGAGTPSYQWYRDSGSGSVLLPGETSATLSDPAPGYYVAVVTLDDCVQSAGLLVQCDFTAADAPCAEEAEWSQEFTGDGVTLAFTVTNFRLPDPDLFTVNQINAAYLVQVNGVTRGFAVTPADGTKYGIDYPNQQIEFAAGFAPEVGEEIRITKLQWLQL